MVASDRSSMTWVVCRLQIPLEEPASGRAGVEFQNEVILFQLVGRRFGGGDDVLEVRRVLPQLLGCFDGFEDGGIRDG